RTSEENMARKIAWKGCRENYINTSASRPYWLCWCFTKTNKCTSLYVRNRCKSNANYMARRSNSVIATRLSYFRRTRANGGKNYSIDTKDDKYCGANSDCSTVFTRWRND